MSLTGLVLGSRCRWVGGGGGGGLNYRIHYSSFVMKMKIRPNDVLCPKTITYLAIGLTLT